MRRFLLVLVLVCVFAAMVLPAAALASPGTVKNAAGHKVGMVSSGTVSYTHLTLPTILRV